jgi:hypothetical protein
MTDDRGTLRKIAWRELFPWLVLFRTFGLSLSVPLVALATVAVLLQPLGWKLSGALFLNYEDDASAAAIRPTHELLSHLPDLGVRIAWVEGLLPAVHLDSGGGDFSGIFHRLSLPFRSLFDEGLSPATFAYFLFGGLWMLALWSVVGGTITRVATVYLGREERISVRDALAYTLKRYVAYFSAPLYPLLGVLLLTIPVALVGLLLWVDIGVIIAGILWFFVLLAALGMAVLLAGLFFGWPLMWPAISAENGDAFEALSRSFGYTFQRPFHYLFYAVIATLFAAICWVFIYSFATLVIHCAWWGASWGAGYDRSVTPPVKRIEDLQTIARMEKRPDTVTASEWYGTRILNFWDRLVYSIALAAAYSLFFCLASAIYLLLRQVDDETEFDEIYMEDEDERYTLPEVKRDTAGVATMSPASPPSNTTTEPPPGERPLSEEE